MPTSPPFTIALIQMSCAPDPQANLDHLIAQIRQAAAQSANIICTPELFATQYFCQSEDPANFAHAEPIPGPTTTVLSKLAKELNIVIIASLFERRAPGLYHNTAVVLDADGSLLGLYRKMHIPDDPLYYEKYYFTPGDPGGPGQHDGFKTFTTKFAQLGVLICWDQWFPEAARLTTLQNCSILFYPTAIAWHPHEKATLGHAQTDAWTTIQRSHAIANGIFVAAINRTGLEQPLGPTTPGLEFFGSSFIANPFGQIIAQAPTNSQQILLATIDPALQEQTRQNWPFLRDRRIDAYDGISNRYKE